MAEFSLPKNSVVGKGKTVKADGASNTKAIISYRWYRDDSENTHMDTFELYMDSCGPLVLEAIIKIKDEIDSTGTFRSSCADGVYGT